MRHTGIITQEPAISRRDAGRGTPRRNTCSTPARRPSRGRRARVRSERFGGHGSARSPRIGGAGASASGSRRCTSRGSGGSAVRAPLGGCATGEGRAGRGDCPTSGIGPNACDRRRNDRCRGRASTPAGVGRSGRHQRAAGRGSAGGPFESRGRARRRPTTERRTGRGWAGRCRCLPRAPRRRLPPRNLRRRSRWWARQRRAARRPR